MSRIPAEGSLAGKPPLVRIGIPGEASLAEKPPLVRSGIPAEGFLAGKAPLRTLNVTGWISEIDLQVFDFRHAEILALQRLYDGVQHLFGCAGG